MRKRKEIRECTTLPSNGGCHLSNLPCSFSLFCVYSVCSQTTPTAPSPHRRTSFLEFCSSYIMSLRYNANSEICHWTCIHFTIFYFLCFSFDGLLNHIKNALVILSLTVNILRWHLRSFIMWRKFVTLIKTIIILFLNIHWCTHMYIIKYLTYCSSLTPKWWPSSVKTTKFVFLFCSVCIFL